MSKTPHWRWMNLKCLWAKKNNNMRIDFLPEMFSWNMTLVSLRKFLPMMKTSSPPLTEQLCSDFFRISGTPAGWAVNTAHTNTKISITVLEQRFFYHLVFSVTSSISGCCFVFWRRRAQKILPVMQLFIINHHNTSPTAYYWFFQIQIAFWHLSTTLYRQFIATASMH